VHITGRGESLSLMLLLELFICLFPLLLFICSPCAAVKHNSVKAQQHTKITSKIQNTHISHSSPHWRRCSNNLEV